MPKWLWLAPPNLAKGDLKSLRFRCLCHGYGHHVVVEYLRSYVPMKVDASFFVPIGIFPEWLKRGVGSRKNAFSKNGYNAHVDSLHP